MKVMVFGTFDILHKGHLSYFKQARKYGDFLIAVIARDKTVKKLRGRLPRNNEKKRVKEVNKYADKAVLGYVYDKMKVVKKYKPDVICLGYDQDSNGLKKFKRMKAYKAHKYKTSKLKTSSI
ncbi:adenylyltransferase/cytidyltransferase family protein [Candidatus Woesearchaeota archaeon]|nr:adenylyltransferase/cytidyltransferase family protein [Candidatus Woesearchaeota archaeon]